jgi:hypothetical protein
VVEELFEICSCQRGLKSILGFGFKQHCQGSFFGFFSLCSKAPSGFRPLTPGTPGEGA